MYIYVATSNSYSSKYVIIISMQPASTSVPKAAISWIAGSFSEETVRDCYTDDLLAMADWLTAYSVMTVVMDPPVSTGFQKILRVDILKAGQSP